MSKTPKRPAAVRLAPVRAAAKQPPTKTDPRWRWQIMVRRDGRYVRVWSGRATVAEVTALVADFHREEEHAAAAGPAVGSVDELLRAWAGAMSTDRTLAPRSRRVYVLRARRVAAVLGHVQVARLSVREIRAAFDVWLAEGLHPGYVRGLYGTLSAAWRWGQVEGIVPARALVSDRDRSTLSLKALTRKRGAGRSRYTPTADEVEQALDQVDDPGWRLALEIAWATGARIGEVGALRWRDVDLRRRVVRFNGKTGGRDVPMSSHLRDTLRAARAELGRVSPTATVHGLPPGRVGRNAWHRLRRACEAAGVHPFGPHGLRRLAVSTAHAAGVPVADAARIFGHSVRVMLTHYAACRTPDQVAAVELLGRGALAPAPTTTKAAVGGRPRRARRVIPLHGDRDP